MAAVERLAYTVEEAAEAIGVSVWTIREAIKAGDLAALSPVVNGRKQRTVLVDVDELRAWLRAGEPA